MEEITIDGLDENHFRLSIEKMLRDGEADEAAARLRALLRPYSGEGKILPARFLTVEPEQVSIAGWDELGDRISQYDRPNHKISALSVAVTDPERTDAQPAYAGDGAPVIETSYFSDDAFPFSEAGRSDLLDGYSHYGCEWDGDSESTDSALSLEGVDDLYGAITRLEARLLESSQPSAEEIRAGTLGACYLGVLLHQTVRDNIRRSGLPRTLCVMAGSNGVYPFFDAPVISSEEYAEHGPAADTPAPIEASGDSTPSGAYTSLLSVQPRKAKKKPVILLDEADSEAAALAHDLAAAQHMADADMAPRGGTVVRLGADAPLRAEPPVAAPEPEIEPAALAEPPVEVDEPVVEAPVPVVEIIPVAETIAVAEIAPVEEPAPIPPPPARQRPSEEPLRLDEAEWIKALSPPAEPAPLPRKAPDSGLGHQGHRLRATMVPTTEERPTLGSRILGFLRRIGIIG